MCDTYTRVSENVRRVRQTIETHMFFCFSLVLQLVFVHLSNNIFVNAATNVNNIKKINFFFYMAPRFEAKVILSAPKRRKSQANVGLKRLLIVFGLMAVDPLKGQILPSFSQHLRDRSGS